jgi:hypothetical protein
MSTALRRRPGTVREGLLERPANVDVDVRPHAPVAGDRQVGLEHRGLRHEVIIPAGEM